MTTSDHFDAIVLGAGAAGLMCARVAGQRGRRVALVDHAAEPGAKILISGGGRCNFTNLHTAPERFLSQNPHFAKSALGRYSPQDFIALVEAHGIAWHEKTLGQLFCDGSARQIVDMMMAECQGAGVELMFGEVVSEISKPDAFEVSCGARRFTAPRLVIATGGLSIPKLGATGFGYDVARQFGLKVVEPRPALVPLRLGPDEQLLKSLSGISVDSIARCNGARFREASLITHRGLSGPAILQVSSYWRHGDEVALDLLPGTDAAEWLLGRKRERPRAEMHTILAERLPARLAETLAARLELAGAIGEQTDKTLRASAAKLANWRFTPNGSEGFAKAEVTVGGVSTASLSSKTMEANKVPGLHVIGEAVDVTGWLGGYNFQWAWASGAAAGQAI